ncbi:MAG: protein kinase [Acidobacteria bacterium]|nr:protein kinase [Acidobacteriota bacterium]
MRAGLPGPLLLDGRYLFLKRLGTGGMGSVFEARHVVLDRLVAVKVLHLADDAAAQSRFRVEAQALGRLDHPGIVKVIDFGVEVLGRGIPYLVMERLEGETLDARRMRRGGRLAPAEALPILEAVASAVDAAHRDGILHRDLKPANVFLSGPENEAPQVRVLDFGVAHLGHGDRPRDAVERRPREGARDLALTADDVIVGTAAYLSPERTWGDAASPASDIYALGVTAFEVLTGQKPFRGGGVEELLLAHSTQPAPRPSAVCPEVPPELDEPLLAALAKVAIDRPATATEYVAGLGTALLEKRAEDERSRDRAKRPRRLALALLACLVVSAGSLLLSRLGPLHAAEDAFFQNLMRAGPRKTADPRLAIAELDDDWLARDSRPLAAQAEAFALATEKLFEAGARSVALDMLLPEAWAESAAFSSLVARRSGALTLAALATPDGKVVGPECLGGHVVAVLGEDVARDLFGFVNLELSAAGYVRRAPRRFLDIEGRGVPSWASHAVTRLEPGALSEPQPETYLLDYRIAVSAIPRVSLATLDAALEKNPRLVSGRLVIVGATFAGAGDQHRFPGEPRQRPGIDVQALGTATLLEKSAPRPAPAAVAFVICLALSGLVFASASLAGRTGSVLRVAALLAGIGVAAGVFFASGLLLPVTALALSSGLALVAVAISGRKTSREVSAS